MNTPEGAIATLPTTLNFFLLALVVTASCLSILQTRRDHVTNSARWIPVSAAMIITSLLVTYLTPHYGGYISAALWLIFVILPSIGFRISYYYFHQSNFAQAYRIKWLANFLHPLADWPWQDALLRAHIAQSNHNLEQAKGILEQALQFDQQPEHVITYHVLMRDWPTLLQWWETHPKRESFLSHPKMIHYYLLALGEMGEIETMAKSFFASEAVLKKVAVLYDYALLYLFAFNGKVEETTKILEVRLSQHIDPEFALYWIATAHCSSQHPEVGRALLKSLLQTTTNGMIAFAAEKRLQWPQPNMERRLSPSLAQKTEHYITDWCERMQLLEHWH